MDPENVHPGNRDEWKVIETPFRNVPFVNKLVQRDHLSESYVVFRLEEKAHWFCSHCMLQGMLECPHTDACKLEYPMFPDPALYPETFEEIERIMRTCASLNELMISVDSRLMLKAKYLLFQTGHGFRIPDDLKESFTEEDHDDIENLLKRTHEAKDETPHKFKLLDDLTRLLAFRHINHTACKVLNDLEIPFRETINNIIAGIKKVNEELKSLYQEKDENAIAETHEVLKPFGDFMVDTYCPVCKKHCPGDEYGTIPSEHDMGCPFAIPDQDENED